MVREKDNDNGVHRDHPARNAKRMPGLAVLGRRTCEPLARRAEPPGFSF
jgi:hypothetical protein